MILSNFRTKHHFLVLALLILVIIFYLLHYSKVLGTGYTLMQVQIILFPIFLLTLNLYLKKKLFRLLSVAAFVLYLLGISTAFSLLPIEDQSILLGRFQVDEFESQTRILRKKINDYLSDKGGLKITRYYASFKDTNDSQLFLKSNPEVFGLLWAGNKGSNKQQLFFSQSSVKPKKVSFSKEQSKSTESLSRAHELLNELKWFESLPEITLPLEPIPAVSAFLAELLYGLRFNSELHLLSAGGIQATWPFSDHLAYARFRLANLYLSQLQTNSEYEKGLLNCTIASQKNAMRILDPSKKDSALGVALRYNSLLVSLIAASESINLKELNRVKLEFITLSKSINLKLKAIKVSDKRNYTNKRLPIMLEFLSNVAREARKSAVLVKKIKLLLNTENAKPRKKQGKRLNKRIKQEAKIGGN